MKAALTNQLYIEPLTIGRAHVFSMNEYFQMGCCRLFGTPECEQCELALTIPRTDCDPPDDCPTCSERARCPCGRGVRNEMSTTEARRATETIHANAKKVDELAPLQVLVRAVADIERTARNALEGRYEE